MKLVIQCAATKQPDGFFRAGDGRSVKFVAHPELAPKPESESHWLARPDDPAPDGRTWRDLVVDYNATSAIGGNPLRLWPAHRLYSNAAYADLVARFGSASVLVLSAGWGLIRSDFLTPQYDITCSPTADPYKRRRRMDVYLDLRQLGGTEEPILFLGGK